MGFFDRFSSRKPEAPRPAETASTGDKPAAAGGVMPQLVAARAKLETKDLPGALAIYEEVLATAGDRADVLVTLSGDLGEHGHVQQIIELVAPRYDATRHGPATGMNLLQAYLVTRNPEAAQHLLDILFSLQRPELEERLFGFSNAIAELMTVEESTAYIPPESSKLDLVSISKPIWFYGLETLAPQLLSAPESKARRVAFVQAAVPNRVDLVQQAAKGEDEFTRLTRGLPLWFAETFYAGAGYQTLAIVAIIARHYGVFPAELTADHVRQVNESANGVDYVVTSALQNRNDDFELTLRIWEVKKSRELKAFTVRWTPATADAELAKFHEQLRGYMEWTPRDTGLAYTPPVAPYAHLLSLGASLSFFLGEKGVLAPDFVPRGTASLLRDAQANPDDARAQIALISALLRLKAQGGAIEPESLQHAQRWLSSPAAQAADASALAIKLA